VFDVTVVQRQKSKAPVAYLSCGSNQVDVVITALQSAGVGALAYMLAFAGTYWLYVAADELLLFRCEITRAIVCHPTETWPLDAACSHGYNRTFIW
jgi:hypothetical protein